MTTAMIVGTLLPAAKTCSVEISVTFNNNQSSKQMTMMMISEGDNHVMWVWHGTESRHQSRRPSCASHPVHSAK